MKQARLLGISPDGGEVWFATDDGEQVAVPRDERLVAAARGDLPWLGQLEIDMSSALTPRDIQMRIRAGASLEEVAAEAGCPAAKIEPFAAPVLAEREHVAGTAMTSPVRRSGDVSNHRTLRTVVHERLLSRGVDLNTLSWDAWRLADRKWCVQVSYKSGEADKSARFVYDQLGRFSVAHDDDARWLLEEPTPSHGPQPGRKPRCEDPDREPTIDFTDEFALVRALDVEAAPEPGPVPAPDPETVTTVDDIDAYERVVDAGDLAADGSYNILPGYDASASGDLDNLYDMLHGFEEDSVSIYTGLDAVTPVGAPVPEATRVPVEAETTTPVAPEPAPDPTPEPDPVITPDPAPLPEPEQLSLIDEKPMRPTPTPKTKKKRASVPSWDEIMFGSPKK